MSKETIKTAVNNDHEVVEVIRYGGFVSDTYTLNVDGDQKHVYKSLDDAIKDFERWSD